MALEVNGVIIPNGADLFVDGVQVQSIEVDGIPVWGLTEAPGTVTDFSATDNEYGQITFDWTPTTGLPSPHYDLYSDGSKLEEDIRPGHTIYTAPGTYTFNLVAYNQDGYTISNYDDGTALVPPSGNVTISADGISGNNPETVSGSFPNYTFTPPQGVRSVDLCLVGGGGGGSGSFRGGSSPGGISGGGSGNITTRTNYSVSSTLDITLGRGGEGSNGVLAPSSGTVTTVGGVTAAGGAGAAYAGNGGSRTTCGGTAANGTTYAFGQILGFVGGQSSGFARGGHGYTHSTGANLIGENGSKGSGGGGAFTLDTYAGVGGRGGDGAVTIKW